MNEFAMNDPVHRPIRQLCDFEAADLCGFTQREDDTYAFDWTQGSASDHQGLLNDHTTGDYYGQYMYVDPKQYTVGAVAGLVSPDVDGVPEACVAFNYYTSHKDGTLEVWLHSKETHDPSLLNIYSAPFQTWIGARQVLLPVSVAGVWQLEFRVTLKSSNGFVALDDVILSPDACPTPVNCDFEANSCLWENTKPAKWTNDDPSQAPAYGYAPPYDHTTGTPYGHYLYFYDNSVDELSATMLSEVFAVDKSSCLSLWIHMYGDKVGTLQIKSIEAEGTFVLKKLTGSLGLEWHQVQIELGESPQHWLSLDVQGVHGQTNVVAVDDIDLSVGLCAGNNSFGYFLCDDGSKIPMSQTCDYQSQCESGEDERWCAGCDFSDDMCGWRMVETGQDSSHYWWRRYTGGDPEDSPHDACMTVESKDGVVLNKPRIISRLQQPTFETCTLSMDYKLQSTGADPAINVYYEHGGSDMTLLFTGQSSSPDWQKLMLPLGRISTAFNFVIEAISSGADEETISLDQVKLTKCASPVPCIDLPPSYLLCDNKACYPAEAKCDFTDDCGDYSDEALCDDYPLRCSFEDGDYCGWDVSDIFQLTEARSSKMPPYRDHTVNTGDGHMLITYSSATIMSPIIQASTNCQFHLYYAISGSSKVTIDLNVVDSATNIIFKQTSKHGEDKLVFHWTHFSASVSYDKPFFIHMWVTVDDRGAAVAFDDFSLTPECIVTPGTPTPPPFSTTPNPCHDQFMCNTENEMPTCIPYDQVCDFEKNCPEGDDESLCGTTDFEADMGGWQDLSDATYSWSRIKASDAYYPNCTAPNADHTNGSTQESPESTAILSSPVVGPAGLGCTFSLWYNCKDDDPLLVITAWTTGDLKDKIVSLPLRCSSNQEWRQGQMFIGEQDQLFTVEVKSTKYFTTWIPTQFDVTIDDTAFTLCSTREDATKEDIKCTFSKPCHFYQSHRDTADYVLVTSKYDKYVSLRGDENERIAVLETLPRQASFGFCLSFRYLIKGQASLEVVNSQATMNETVFVRKSGYLDWQTVHLNLYSSKTYQIEFVGHTSASNGEVSLDDIELVEGLCPPPLTCTFDDDSDNCLWKNYFTGASLPWSIGRGNENITSEPEYASLVDHSWGTPFGHYQYLNIAGDQSGKVAFLKSTEIATTTPDGDCFQFWFYLYSKV
ncbi:MAM and LDL-receptor class A domain-containing protein 2 [Portunus trituberculatus]|uniref:MAM and LDL-receptor class A domain-containing protein 2 n=1 Tax=Portunus trituberculatus TaxID=210409 RepID=A0A5B7EC19_PORTR|nr:MAM and LDL-receptor class A domain-containing protein 2 [Portunus trituberculatus]